MTMRPGDRLGDFVIEELIGAGGMGTVYRARDVRHDRTVALKVLSGDYEDEDPGAGVRFTREARAIGDVRHPAIAGVYHSGEDEGRHWIAMQFVPGDSLEAMLRRRGPMPLRAVPEVLGPIASALDELHGAHHPDGPGGARVHRDIKPANIIVAPPRSPGPRATLVDFGIARRVDGRDGMTATDAVTGSSGFVAPEAFSERGDQRGPAADRYSFAVVAFLALTGELPFPASAMTPAEHRAAWDKLSRPSRLRPGIPGSADAVFARALHTDPRARFPTCERFVHELRRCAAAEPGRPSLGGPSRGQPSPRNRRSTARRGGQLLVGAGVLVVVLAVLGVLLWPQLPWRSGRATPAVLHAAYPQLVPEHVDDPGYQGASCSLPDPPSGAVAEVECSSADLAYRATAYADGPSRDAALGLPDRPQVTLTADGRCTVGLADLGDDTKKGRRNVAFVPAGTYSETALLASVPAGSWEDAQHRAATVPFC